MMNKITKTVLMILLMLALIILCFAGCKKKVTDDEPGSSDSAEESSALSPDPVTHTVNILEADGSQLHLEKGEAGTLVVFQPEREGYVFDGYYSDAEFKSSVSFDGKIGNADITLYVKWNPIHYTVRFDSGRGVGEMKEISATYDEKVTLPVCAFVLMDETFEEWRMTDSDGTVRSFVDSGSIKNLTTKNGDTVTLTAVFDNLDSRNFTVENGVVLSYNGNAKKVRFPETGRIVSPDVFKNCPTASEITKIEVPSCYVEIGLGAFAPLTRLEEVRLPFIGQSEDKNTYFSYVFGAESYKDSYFKFSAEVQYGSLVEVDGDYSHLLVPKTLKKVVITNPLKRIAEGAFYHAYSVEKILILDSSALYEVGDSAFEGCINLGYDSELQIGNPLNWLSNVERIGNRAFAAYISEKNKDGSTYIFTHLFMISSLDKIETIGNQAFYGCVYLLNLEVGDKLKFVGDEAFVNCVSLSSLTLPDSIESVGAYAFASCAGLTELVIGKNISKIGSMAFADCEALSQVTLRSASPALISQIPFSNGIEYSYDINGSITGYTPVFTTLSVYVDSSALAAYKSAWADYRDVLDTKTNDFKFYWGPNSDGSFATKFEVHGGNVANVTDTDLEFLDNIDRFSELYNSFRDDIVDNKYTLSIEKVEVPDGVRVGNEEFYRISHSRIVDALGDPTSFLIRVRTERYEMGGNTYYVPVAERADTYFGTVGDKQNSLYIIEKDDWGHYTLLKRENLSSDFVSAMPSEALYGDYRIYYILSYSEKMVRMDWYDKDAKLIKTDKFMLCDDCLYPVSDESSLELCFTDYPTQIILNGHGQALFTLYEDGSFAEYLGTYAVVDNGKIGDENLTVILTDLMGKGNTYSGKMVLDGFFDDAYHRCNISVSSDSKFYNATLYASSGLKNYNICYSPDEVTYYAFYDYLSDDGKSEVHFVEFNDGEVSSHGTYTASDKLITMEIDGYPKTVGHLTDERGSFTVETILGDKLFTAYDDWENSIFYMEENFLGTVLTYYVIKMDGYGNALFYDGHDDGYDNWYKGTYYSTHEVIGSDENGDMEIYYFTGVECDESGRVLKNGKTFSAYYVLGTMVYDDEDDDGNLTYSGEVIAVSKTTETTHITAYDEKGLKFAELSVSPFGAVTMTVYNTEYKNGEYISVANEELTSRFSAVAYQTSAGELVYIVVLDGAGDYMFRICENENGKWIYEDEGAGEPKETPEDLKIYPDLGDNVEITK